MFRDMRHKMTYAVNVAIMSPYRVAIVELAAEGAIGLRGRNHYADATDSATVSGKGLGLGDSQHSSNGAVVEVADTADLKSAPPQGGWGFESPRRQLTPVGRREPRGQSALLSGGKFRTLTAPPAATGRPPCDDARRESAADATAVDRDTPAAWMAGQEAREQ